MVLRRRANAASREGATDAICMLCVRAGFHGETPFAMWPMSREEHVTIIVTVAGSLPMFLLLPFAFT